MYVPLDEQLVHTKYKSSGIVEKIQFKDIILSVSLTTDDGDTDDCVLWLKNPSRDDLKSLKDGLFFRSQDAPLGDAPAKEMFQSLKLTQEP